MLFMKDMNQLAKYTTYILYTNRIIEVNCTTCIHLLHLEAINCHKCMTATYYTTHLQFEGYEPNDDNKDKIHIAKQL